MAGDLRSGQLLPRVDGPRPVRSSGGSATGCWRSAGSSTSRALATNDCHYVTRDAAHNHEALLCVQTGKTLSDPNRFKFDGDGYYLKSAAEMRSLWDDELPGACDSTLLIAERVSVLRGRVGPARPDAGLPGARRARPGVVAAPRGRRRAGAAVPGRGAARIRRARRATRSRSSAPRAIRRTS